MSDCPNHRAIEERAVAWLARRDSGEWTSENEARFTAWLNAATAHRVAYLRLESVWESAGKARALSTLPPGIVPPVGQWRRSPFFTTGGTPSVSVSSRRHGKRWLAAAAALLITGLAVGYRLNWLRPGNVYSTPVGVISSVPLADGSMVTLNTASRIRVEFEPEARRVILEKGEAYFVVKKNAARPFVVIAGNQRIVDLGTHFSVRREDMGIQVIVTEGMVQLESPRPRVPVANGTLSTPPSQRLAPIGVPLTAGTVALSQDGNLLVHKESIHQAQEMVSWSTGYLTFQDTTLADAVAEFNRYNDRSITIDDLEVAGIRISGTFRPTNYLAFVRLLHEGYGIHVKITPQTILLSKR